MGSKSLVLMTWLAISFLKRKRGKLLKDEQEAAFWRPINQATMNKLTNDFSQLRIYRKIQLSLDSTILTADGAMIVCFLDDDHHSFHKLRSHCISTAKDVLRGELTSRPKNLIHVTLALGCMLGIPESTTKHQQQEITELMRYYNTVVLPEKVAEIQQSSQHEIQLEKVSLLRDTVWLLEDFVEYGCWELQ